MTVCALGYRAGPASLGTSLASVVFPCKAELQTPRRLDICVCIFFLPCRRWTKTVGKQGEHWIRYWGFFGHKAKSRLSTIPLTRKHRETSEWQTAILTSESPVTLLVLLVRKPETSTPKTDKGQIFWPQQQAALDTGPLVKRCAMLWILNSPYTWYVWMLGPQLATLF